MRNADGPPVLVAGSGGGHVGIWELEQGRLLARLPNAHVAPVSGLEFLPQEGTLLSSASDNALRVHCRSSSPLSSSPLLSALLTYTQLLSGRARADCQSSFHTNPRNSQTRKKLTIFGKTTRNIRNLHASLYTHPFVHLFVKSLSQHSNNRTVLT